MMSFYGGWCSPLAWRRLLHEVAHIVGSAALLGVLVYGAWVLSRTFGKARPAPSASHPVPILTISKVESSR